MSHLLSFLSYLLVSPSCFPPLVAETQRVLSPPAFLKPVVLYVNAQPPSLDLVVQPQGLHSQDFWAGLTWSLPGDADAAWWGSSANTWILVYVSCIQPSHVMRPRRSEKLPTCLDFKDAGAFLEATEHSAGPPHRRGPVNPSLAVAHSPREARFPKSQRFPQMSLRALNRRVHWEKLFAPFGSFEASAPKE